MNILEKWDLPNHFFLARVDRFSDSETKEMIDRHVLHEYPTLYWREAFSSDQKEKHERINGLMKDAYRLRLGVFSGERLVGMSFGWQHSVYSGDFYMAASLVLPEFRNQGLYSAMVSKVLELTKAEGFSAVRSRHICTNNAVLIAKLKLGFTIHGFEQDEIMGSLVNAIYFHDEIRKKAMYFRAGKLSEAESLKPFLSVRSNQ